MSDWRTPGISTADSESIEGLERPKSHTGALCVGLTSPLTRQRKLGHLLFLRHPGLAQSDEIGGFKQDVDLRNIPICVGLYLGEARKRTLAQQPAGLGKFGGGTIGLAFERKGRGKPEVWPR